MARARHQLGRSDTLRATVTLRKHATSEHGCQRKPATPNLLRTDSAHDTKSQVKRLSAQEDPR